MMAELYLLMMELVACRIDGGAKVEQSLSKVESRTERVPRHLDLSRRVVRTTSMVMSRLTLGENLSLK